MAAGSDVSRCMSCGAPRGVGAIVTVTTARRVDTWYVCGVCAHRVDATLAGMHRVNV